MAPRTHKTTKKTASLATALGMFFRQLLLFLLIAAIAIGFGYFTILPRVFQVTQPTNIVIVSKDLQKAEAVVLVHFSPQLRRSAIALFDGSERVEVLGGYGQYSIQSLYTLLQLDGKDPQFVRAAFSHALGVVVDEVVAVEGLTKSDVEQKELHTLLQPLIWSTTSGLSWQKRATYFMTAKGFRANETRIDKKNNLLDALKGYPLLTESDAQECQIAVVNTTNTPKLASGVSQLLEMAGAMVVRVGNDTTRFDKSVFFIKTESPACARVITKAQHVFPYLPEVVVDAAKTQQYRASLVLMVGADLGQAVETPAN